MQTPLQPSGRGKVISALLLLVGVALGAHLIWALLSPVLPALIAVTILAVLVALFLGRRS